MPIYDYKCTDCGEVYDVFHKSREVIEDITCPACHSTKYKKLMSVPSISMGGTATASSSEVPSCPAGGCCGEACELN